MLYLGDFSYRLSIVGILVAASMFAPLAILVISYLIAGLLVHFAITKAVRFVRWIGPSVASRPSLPGTAAQITA